MTKPVKTKVSIKADVGRATTNVAIWQGKPLLPKDVITFPSLIAQVMGCEDPDLIENSAILERGTLEYLIGNAAINAEYSEVSTAHGFHGDSALSLLLYGIAQLFPSGGDLDIALDYSIEHSAFISKTERQQIQSNLGASHVFSIAKGNKTTRYDVSLTIKFVSQAKASMAYLADCVAKPSVDNLVISAAGLEKLNERKARYPFNRSSALTIEIGSNNTAFVRKDANGNLTVAENVMGINNVRSQLSKVLDSYGKYDNTSVDRLISEYAINPKSEELVHAYDRTVIEYYEKILSDVLGKAYSVAKGKMGGKMISANYIALTGGGAFVMRHSTETVKDTLFSVGQSTTLMPLSNPATLTLAHPHLSVILGMGSVK